VIVYAGVPKATPISLVELMFTRVSLTDAMLPRLRALVPRLRRLSLRGNLITDAGVPLLVDILAVSATSLRHLDVSQNALTPVGLRAIEEVVLSEWLSLREVVVHGDACAVRVAVERRAAQHEQNALLTTDALEERLASFSAHANTNIDLSRAYALPRVAVHTARDAWQQLRSITLANCALTTLAPLAGALASCVALESLCLMNNALCDLPHGVSAMLGHASALTSLDLSFNAFATLPVGVRDATALRRLNLRSNRLDTLPLLHSDVALRTLDLSSNQLSEWPAALDDTLLRQCRTLRLAHNRLTLVPSLMLGKLTHLEYLSLFGNPLTNHDATHESDELLDEMRAQQQPASSARALRVLVLGKERVGKTS
jgi:Leucine-rich repeat (LRR) protein